MNLNWATIATLIAQYGLPFAISVYQKWASGTAPTQADFDELNRLANQKAVDLMKTQLTLAGIPLTDPHAVALLALVQPS